MYHFFVMPLKMPAGNLSTTFLSIWVSRMAREEDVKMARNGVTAQNKDVYHA